MEYEEVALFALAFLLEVYPDALKARYKLDTLPVSDTEMLSLLGTKRGCLRAGGVVDLYQAATILLQDLRSGKLGPLTLETPATMDAELTELRAAIAAKQEAEKNEKPMNNGS